jgi:hypothetical protein
MGRKRIDLVGHVFGRLTVLCVDSKSKKQGVIWSCLCACGNRTSVAAGDLRKKLKGTKSCGCLAKETARDLLKTHGMTNTRTFNVWSGMIARCTNYKTKNFKNWGGRGIKICDRWLNSFENFIEDMGECPSNNFCIDRIDNNGDYELQNCRWATYKEQNKNRRSTNFITFNNLTKSVSEWAEYLKISRPTLSTRLWKLGWTVEKAFTTPVLLKRQNGQKE